MTPDAGNPQIDAVLESVCVLCCDEIRQVLASRDAVLSGNPARGVLSKHGLEVLSEVAIDLDQKLS